MTAISDASSNDFKTNNVEVASTPSVSDVTAFPPTTNNTRTSQQTILPQAVQPAAVAQAVPGTLEIVGTGLVQLGTSIVLGGQLAETKIAHNIIDYIPLAWGFLTNALETSYIAFPDIPLLPTTGYANVVGQYYQISANDLDVTIDYIANGNNGNYVRFYLMKPVTDVQIINNMPRTQLF